MNYAVLISVGLAGAVGLVAGFRKRWTEACLFACLAVPATVSVIFAMSLDAPTFLDAVGWTLVTFFYAFNCAFIAWGLCAGTNHAGTQLYRKLIGSSRRNVPQSADH